MRSVGRRDFLVGGIDSLLEVRTELMRPQTVDHILHLQARKRHFEHNLLVPFFLLHMVPTAAVQDSRGHSLGSRLDPWRTASQKFSRGVR